MNLGHHTRSGPNSGGLTSQAGAFILASHATAEPARQKSHNKWPDPPMPHLQGDFITAVERSVGHGPALPDPVEDKHSFPSGELTSSAWEGWCHKEPTENR